MTFKEVSYNYNEIARTLFKKGKRKKDDPVKQLKNDLKDKNIIYFFIRMMIVYMLEKRILVCGIE